MKGNSNPEVVVAIWRRVGGKPPPGLDTTTWREPEVKFEGETITHSGRIG